MDNPLLAHPSPAMLAWILRETETRLKAFDELVEGTCAGLEDETPRAILHDWRELRSGLYVTLGAARTGSKKES
jgi:hypothetical protein